MEYLRQKYLQLAPHGHLIIRDVVGVERMDDPVYLWLTNEAASSDNEASAENSVAHLSLYDRFFRFAQDYLPQRRQNATSPIVPYRLESIGDDNYIFTSLRLAVEFITKMDYTDNWASEMHEEFAFWSFGDWKRALREVGFNVRQPSHVYTNDWIVRDRWDKRVALFQKQGDMLLPLPYPPTTMVLVAEKPQALEDLHNAY
jgi:hypothetical protein